MADFLKQRISNRHDDGHGDKVEGLDCSLDFTRVDVVTAGLEHLLDAPNNMEPAVFVNLAEVTGLEPAILGHGLCCGFPPAEIAGENARAAHDDLAPLAMWALLSILADDRYFKGRNRSSDRLGHHLDRIVWIRESDAGCCLRHAPAIDHRPAEQQEL